MGEYYRDIYEIKIISIISITYQLSIHAHVLWYRVYFNIPQTYGHWTHLKGLWYFGSAISTTVVSVTKKYILFTKLDDSLKKRNQNLIHQNLPKFCVKIGGCKLKKLILLRLLYANLKEPKSAEANLWHVGNQARS